MKFQVKSKQEKLAPLKEWHRKFAWLPTWIRGRNWVWLEFYERRLKDACEGMGGTSYHWEHRMIKPAQERE